MSQNIGSLSMIVAPPLVMLPLTSWMYVTYIRDKPQTSLDEEFDNIGVHHYMFIARNFIHDAAIYSIHALNKAQKVLADF